VLRLLHTFQPGEHPELSKPAVVDIGAMFAGVSIATIEERSLTLNRKVSRGIGEGNTTVSLRPLEIRSFVVTLKADAEHSPSPAVTSPHGDSPITLI
jgi:hypothetical protein